MSETSTNKVIDRLAQPQRGLVVLRQATEKGLTPKQLQLRAQRGSLRRIDAGIYATMGSATTWEQQVHAACLAAGSEALASHRTAAALWGLTQPTGVVEVVVPYESCPTPAGTILHRSTDLRPIDASRRQGIPLTNPIRTVGDLGAVAPELVPGAVEKGLYLRLFGLAALWRLIDDLARPGRRGLGVLRRVLERRALGNQRSCSPLEPIFAAIAQQAGVRLVYQHPVVVEGSRYVLDFALPDIMVAIEIDGLEVHGTRDALDHDLERQNRLILDGWHLLRYTATHLVKHRARVREELLRLVEQRLLRL